MNERPPINTFEQSESEQINTLDQRISDGIQALEKSGLNMQKWNDEYENLPEDFIAFTNFYNRLFDFQQKRQDALMTYEFSSDLTEEEKIHIRSFDRQIMMAYQDHENFLGNGASAEVYAMRDNDAVCVKFITSQDAYDENNHLRTEFDILSHMHQNVKDKAVRTPYPVFLRIHPNEGHSYGMEKLPGASLSQMLEFPDRYPELLQVAQEVDSALMTQQLLEFVAQMHESGITHGDLFKRNLMFDEDGKLYVIDFGKAKKIQFSGDREDAKQSDIYCAKQSLVDFFRQVNELTISIK